MSERKPAQGQAAIPSAAGSGIEIAWIVPTVVRLLPLIVLLLGTSTFVLG